MSIFKIFSVALMLILLIKGLLSFIPAILVFLALYGGYIVYHEFNRKRKP